MSSRAYHSPLRAAEAAATRARIVDAAASLFAEHGYAATPLKAIADRAGVSIQTVHHAGPKSSLLMAAFERAFAGDEGPPAERPEMAAIMADPDPESWLPAYVAFLAEANGRSARLWRVLHVAADGDPVIREQVESLDGRRRRELGLAAAWLRDRGLIPADAVQQASDRLAFYASPDAYLHFVDASGWSDDAYAAWLGESLRGLMAGPA